jgi:hypothetical protein
MRPLSSFPRDNSDISEEARARALKLPEVPTPERVALIRHLTGAVIRTAREDTNNRFSKICEKLGVQQDEEREALKRRMHDLMIPFKEF